MNKEKILKQLDDLKNAVIYNIFSQSALHQYIKVLVEEKRIPFQIPDTVLPNKKTLSFENFLINNLEVKTNKNKAITCKRQSNVFCTKHYFKEIFRKAKSWLRFNQLEHKARANQWYRVANEIANSIAHDDVINYNSDTIETLKKKPNSLTFITEDKLIFKFTLEDQGKLLSITLNHLCFLIVKIEEYINSV